ncbi:MAG: exodeoxyribonuclease VII small subunit [Chloroflexota bacterium]|nr:exodeoxyribonuclease VII small subunit [Chloroflexota bacterium]
MNATNAPGREEPSFEERLEELETLVEELEAGDLCLEEMLQRYEQGMTLIAACQDRLERAELRITEIAASGDDR